MKSTPPKIQLQGFAKFSANFMVAAIALGLGIGGIGLLLSPNTKPENVRLSTEADAQAAEAARNTSFDPQNPPVLQRDVDYSQGTAGAWYPKGESPALRELVQEGKIEPVDQRTGPEPLVLEGVDGIGKYGGTWMRLAPSDGDIAVITWRLSTSNLVRWSPMGAPVKPHLAKGWSVSEDRREWTFYLRKGVRWSDGHPFTSADITFWWELETYNMRKGGSPPNWMTTSGQPGQVIAVDDYTVKFVFEETYGNFPEALASKIHGGPYSPRHYLRQFHEEFGNQDLIDAVMKAKNLTTKAAVYGTMNSFLNPELPRMTPWIYRTYKNNPPQNFVRNPYYWAVDPQGNQLPYVDRILFEVKTPKLIPVAASAGGVTMQERNLTFDNYTLLMENRKNGDYEVYHWFPGSRSAWSLWPNTTRATNDVSPGAALKSEFLKKREFRQALSLAIDRGKIIAAVYNNLGEPAQIEPGRASEFHNERLMKAFTEYDPARANALLDSIGLNQRDSEGMRTFPNGQRMSFNIDFTEFTGEGPSQFVIHDWAAVGVRAVARERTRALFTREQNALTQDFACWSGESEFDPLVEPRSFVPVNEFSLYAPAYGIWYRSGGLYNLQPEKVRGLPPPRDSVFFRNIELLEQAMRAPDRASQVAIFRQITDAMADEVWSISIATPPPQLVVVRNGFKNVPRNAIYGASYATPAAAGVETFYFENPQNPQGVFDQVKHEMTNVTPGPNSVDAKTMQVSSKGSLGGIIRLLLYGSGALALGLVALRHPYIGRRILIMVPTLLIISVIVFVVIQIPPGDFIETRILELTQNGDQSSIRDIERLRELFMLDEPMWKRYVNWLGLEWFVSFDPTRRGLLQGEMGRSMDTGRSVNSMVGDRVVLTFIISLATIVFTWVVALPIGIYSAARQYSLGDYVLTFFGFIGMCVPNFLLAILLMYWSSKYLGINVTGLFSPEYAADPAWSWGKVWDLLSHVWVPVVVIAVSSTAGMIRIMRGNLLDELRKPYVTTAMAKGVRPFKLLMKYPVRLALNPFISGIGGIFPALISGGAIVAIILSLPMVGPILLQGLLTEDVYLAASMLMVLSLLGMFGTLVSDIMLLWLDPRIRMSGGSK